jgi:translation initiation factor 2 subunit 3
MFVITMTSKIIQPEINIGLVGHVDHGKTSLVAKLSGRWTDEHSEEIKRGITIRLGYADASFYKCSKCKDPECYGTSSKCKKCYSGCELVKKVSFVDAPGHETLMATMISGAAIMDGALLLIAANEKCPQPQTREHLMALEIIGIKNIIIVQNKIDLVSKEEALENYNDIKKFLKGTIAEKAPIIPVSAQHEANIDILIKTIVETFKTPKRDLNKNPLFFVARSFDVNKPGTEIKKLVGGVLGGALKQGKLKVGDEIEIRPGIKKEIDGKYIYKELKTKVTGIKTGGMDVKEVIPGGSLGISTLLDPSIVKSDNLTGNVVGLVGKLPKVWYEFRIKQNLLKRVVGAKDNLVVEPIKKGEILMFNVNSASTIGEVIDIKKDFFYVRLKIPVCADIKDRITISRKLGDRWRLIGWGEINE